MPRDDHVGGGQDPRRWASMVASLTPWPAPMSSPFTTSLIRWSALQEPRPQYRRPRPRGARVPVRIGHRRPRPSDPEVVTPPSVSRSSDRPWPSTSGILAYRSCGSATKARIRLMMRHQVEPLMPSHHSRGLASDADVSSPAFGVTARSRAGRSTRQLVRIARDVTGFDGLRPRRVEPSWRRVAVARVTARSSSPADRVAAQCIDVVPYFIVGGVQSLPGTAGSPRRRELAIGTKRRPCAP